MANIISSLLEMRFVDYKGIGANPMTFSSNTEASSGLDKQEDPTSADKAKLQELLEKLQAIDGKLLSAQSEKSRQDLIAVASYSQDQANLSSGDMKKTLKILEIAQELLREATQDIRIDVYVGVAKAELSLAQKHMENSLVSAAYAESDRFQLLEINSAGVSTPFLDKQGFYYGTRMLEQKEPHPVLRVEANGLWLLSIKPMDFAPTISSNQYFKMDQVLDLSDLSSGVNINFSYAGESPVSVDAIDFDGKKRRLVEADKSISKSLKNLSYRYLIVTCDNEWSISY